MKNLVFFYKYITVDKIVVYDIILLAIFLKHDSGLLSQIGGIIPNNNIFTIVSKLFTVYFTLI